MNLSSLPVRSASNFVLVSPHPGPLPRGEGEARAACCKISPPSRHLPPICYDTNPRGGDALPNNRMRCSRFPLPEGEGQGEGERGSVWTKCLNHRRYFPRLCSTVLLSAFLFLSFA